MIRNKVAFDLLCASLHMCAIMPTAGWSKDNTVAHCYYWMQCSCAARAYSQKITLQIEHKYSKKL